jgi:hypothetical protein
MKRLSPLVPLLGLILAIPAAADSQKAMKLTAQDYIDIEQIVYRYANALDYCADNGNSYAGLFVADGEFGSTPSWDVPPIKIINGHDALALVGGGTGPGGACKDPKLSRNYGATHITVNLVITPAAGGAIGKSIPLLIGADGDPTKIICQGGKQDFFVKTREGWRLKSEWHVELADPRSAPKPP